MKTILPILSICLLLSCNSTEQDQVASFPKEKKISKFVSINENGNTIESRFLVPKGFERTNVAEGSFGHYLRKLPLKKGGSPVLYYDGRTKNNSKVYAAVVDMDLDKRDLQQCADAVMRLRGEYLFREKKFDQIKFNYLSDGKPRYFKTYAKGDNSYSKFRKYMIQIFSYANTSSLRDELVVRPIMEMEIGDTFIQKGKPYGHAVIVVDMAEKKATGEKVYMLAQSYMPAQDTQILLNPMNEKLSPWYQLNKEEIRTPEWSFIPEDLRRF